jgi:hypothetical protein
MPTIHVPIKVPEGEGCREEVFEGKLSRVLICPMLDQYALQCRIFGEPVPVSPVRKHPECLRATKLAQEYAKGIQHIMDAIHKLSAPEWVNGRAKHND